MDLPILPEQVRDKIVRLVDEFASFNDVANEKDSQALSIIEREMSNLIQ